MIFGPGIGIGFGRRRRGYGADGSGFDFLPGQIIDDGSPAFTEPPVVVEISDGIKFRGKKSSGASGKFIYNIGLPAPNRQYTLKYDPDWSLLENGGVSAMVGFGFKRGNQFRVTGLKGDGSTGLKAYEIYGGNWNETSGFSTSDGGAAANGTQAGPNWIRLKTAASGATYTVQSSSDGVTWSDEFTDIVPLPFSDLSVPSQFGIAVFLEAGDAGPFNVDITLWIEAEADNGLTLDGLAGLTGAWSLSRDLITSFVGGSRYTLNGSNVSSLNDQSGNSRHLAQGGAGSQPPTATAGANSRIAIDFVPASTDSLVGAAISSFITNSAGYIICSGIVDAFNSAAPPHFGDEAFFADSGGFIGWHVVSTPAGSAYNWDGDSDVMATPHAMVAGDEVVVEWKHEGGTLYSRLNGGEWLSKTSGNTTTMTGTLQIGKSSGAVWGDYKFFEMACFSAVPSTAEQDALSADFMAWIGA